MAKQPKQSSVDEGTPPCDRHVFDLGERWLGPANRLDYVIRRCMIPDHPANDDRKVANNLPYRLSAPYLSWELTRTLSNKANSSRMTSHVRDLQAAIGRGLRAEYDDLMPAMPARLVALLRKVEQPASP
jgi:hypothetical protein